CFGRGIRAGTFVAVDHRRRLAADRDRRDLGIEAAGLCRRDSLPMAVQRVLVHLGPADTVLLGDRFGGVAHVMLLEWAPEAIVDDGILQLARPETETLAGGLEQGRRAAHALH